MFDKPNLFVGVVDDVTKKIYSFKTDFWEVAIVY